MKNLIITLFLSSLVTFAFSQVKVISNGNVGIGGITPAYELDVNGKFQVRGSQFLVGKDAGSSTVVFKLGANRSADGSVGFDFVSDQSKFPQYGDRFLRNHSGISVFSHRGDKPLRFINSDEGIMAFHTKNIQRIVIEPLGDVGVGTTNPTSKLQVGGDVKASDYIVVSDKRLKTNINKFEGGLDKLMQIQPYTYEYNGKADLTSDLMHYGVLAQELEQIEPNAVDEYIWEKHDEEGNAIESETYKSVQPAAIQYITVNAVQEQQQIIDLQEERIAKLESQIATLLESNNQSIDISGGNPTKAVLGDNFPNPFDGKTDIRYFVPENSTNVTLNLYDNSGKLIRSVKIAERGNGVLNININDMPAGVYNYQMIVDDKLVATKKMILGN